MGAEGDDVVHSRLPGGGGEAVELRIIAVEDGDAVPGHALENFRLGLGDVVDGFEMGHVHGFDIGDHGNVGPHHPRQGRDLTRVVHADLEHPEGGIGGHPRQAQRHPPVVVEAALAGSDRALFLEHEADRLFGAGLADAAGDGNDSGAGAAAGGLSQILEGAGRVLDLQQRRIAADRVRPSFDHRRGGAGGKGVSGEIVAVEPGPADGDEQIAGFGRPAVDGNAIGAPFAMGNAAGGGERRTGGPEICF